METNMTDAQEYAQMWAANHGDAQGNPMDIWKDIPHHMRDAVAAYIMHGQIPGSFLQAVICNDLAGACRKADDINVTHLRDYVRFFYNNAPSGVTGSVEAMNKWANAGGLVAKLQSA
jgi:hypothetical protein